MKVGDNIAIITAVMIGILIFAGLPVAVAQDIIHTRIGHAGSALLHFVIAQVAIALMYIAYKSMKATGQVQTFIFFVVGIGLLAILSLLKLLTHIMGVVYRTVGPNLHDIDMVVTLIAYLLMLITFYKWSKLLK